MGFSIKQINYFYLAFVLLWQPLQIAFVQVDGAGRIPFFLTILVFVINYINDPTFKKQILTTPTLFWAIWGIYSSVNLLVHGYYGEIPFLFFLIHSLFTPFLVMLLTSKEVIRNKKHVLQLLSVVFIIYAVLSVTVLGAQTNADSERSLGALWNEGPLTALFIVFFLGLLYVNNWLTIRNLIPLILFVFVIIALGGTRKAFGGAILLLATLVISQLTFSPRKIIMMLILAGFAYCGYTYVMEHTSMGDRFKEGLEVGENTNTTNIKLLNLVGDRATFYITGWQVFSENPVTGIGLGNYMRETGSEYVIHSEYIVQLAEGGLIGTSLFLLFNLGIAKCIYRAWKKYPKERPVIWMLLGAFIVILFIGVTAWTYSFTRYFMVYGIIIGCLRSFKYEVRKKMLRKNKRRFNQIIGFGKDNANSLFEYKNI